MSQFYKKILLGTFSLLLVAATLFADYRLEVARAQTEQKVDIAVVEKGDDAVLMQSGEIYTVDSGSSRMSLQIKESTALRLAPASQIKLSFAKSPYARAALSIELAKGRLWISTLNSSLPSEIKTTQVTLTALPGVYDISYNTPELVVTAHRHNIEAAFTGARVVIPEHRYMAISEEKLTQSGGTIARLHYSKLFKEFPYFENEKPDGWTSQNVQDDEAFTKSLQEKFEHDVRAQGPAFGTNENSLFFKLQNFSGRVSAALTFDTAKKDRKEAHALFDYFNSGLYNALIGKDEAAALWFNYFKIKFQEARTTEAVRESLLQNYDRLAHFPSSSNLNTAKLMLRDMLDLPQLTLLQTSFHEVLDIAQSGSDIETVSRMQTSLRRFGTAADRVVTAIQSREQSDDIFFQSVLINDFLNRNPLLMREEFLKIAEIFEKAHLNLIVDKADADDQRQFFIATRLARIDTLRKIMEKGDMPFQDGRRSLLLLIAQIDALKPALSDTAVLTYFDNKLVALRPFITFLRSNSAENLRGSFHESFKEFETRTAELQKVNELLNTATGGIQISPVRREELAALVTADLGGVGVSNIKVSLPEGEDDPRVIITSATMEGLEFTGVYDTVRKVLSNVATQKDEVQSAIRLENIKRFFLVKTGKLQLGGGQKVEDLTEAPSAESLIEKVTREKFKKAFEEVRINVEEKYFGFENLNDGVVHIRLASIGDGADAKVFSFDISQKTSIVSGLKVQTVFGEIPVNDSFALRELPIKVEQIYQRAVFEKQKEEELKKFAQEGTVEEKPIVE